MKADGTVVLESRNINGMYLLEPPNDPPDVSFTMTSLSQPMALEQWH